MNDVGSLVEPLTPDMIGSGFNAAGGSGKRCQVGRGRPTGWGPGGLGKSGRAARADVRVKREIFGDDWRLS